tara:strand:+ start:21453 stop:21716 length:264 start_codon:yes stop_codon:yes gene_type:complete
LELTGLHKAGHKFPFYKSSSIQNIEYVSATKKGNVKALREVNLKWCIMKSLQKHLKGSRTKQKKANALDTISKSLKIPSTFKRKKAI